MPTTPSHLATFASTDAMGMVEDPAQGVIVCCERAKVWLAQALADDAIESIVELKSIGEQCRLFSLQMELGKDAELAAIEIIRRAERCLAAAVRKGQEQGTVRKQGEHGRQGDGEDSTNFKKHSPSAFFSNSYERDAAYAMNDGVSDEQFDDAIETAKAEKNLSRANVKRKLNREDSEDRWARLADLAASGHHSSQIADELGFSRQSVIKKAKALGIDLPADRVMGKSRLRDEERVLREIVSALDALTPSCESIEPHSINRAALVECSAGLTNAIKELRKLDRRLQKEIANG